MRGCWRVVSALLIVTLATGCTTSVDGTAEPAPNLRPRPLSGPTVKQVLLDDIALSRMLGQPFVARMPPAFGGVDKLNDRSVSPADCLGVTAMLQKGVYQTADVKDVALESWWNNGEPAQVLSVMEGVVTLPTAAQADAQFAQFSKQWQQCKGTTTTEQNGPIKTTTAIGDVRVANSIVAATNNATSVLPNLPALQPMPQARALGVRLNSLVEVEVVFFGDRRPSDPGSANPDTSAIDIAHVMMDKVSALS